MAVTVEVGTGTILSTEDSADTVRESLAAIDATSKEAPPAEGGEESAPAAETAPDKPAPAIVQERESDGKFKAGGKKDAQSRIAHVTWEREEARRQAAAAQQRAEQLERDLAEYKKRPEPRTLPFQNEAPKTLDASRKPVADGRPSEDEVGTTYQTYADYVEAVADWKVEQRFKAQQQQVQQTEAERAHQTQRSAHHERVAAWRAANPTQAAEFDELTKTPSPDLPPAMVSAILDSQQGPALLHFLASHPEECLQLMAEAKDLPPSAAPWVRRALESKVTAPAAPSGPAPAVTRSPVPAPIQPVGASPVVSEVDTSTLKGRAYLEAENAKELARLRRQRGIL